MSSQKCFIWVFIICHLCLKGSSSFEAWGAGDWCQSWKNLICGSDGVSYWNDCLFHKRQNIDHELKLIAAGACEPTNCADCDPSNNEIYFCTTSNLLLTSNCHLECFKEDYPHVKQKFNGCLNRQANVTEIEKASPELLLDIFKTFLEKAFKLENQSLGNALTQYLTPFHHLLHHNEVEYTVRATRGWMEPIKTMAISGEMILSSTVPGRFSLKLNTGLLKVGYKNFVITAGMVRSISSLTMTLKNATLEVTADLATDSSSCTKINPMHVELVDVPSVEVNTSNNISSTFTLPKYHLQGFMKENFVQKINEATEKSLFVMMRGVGCLNNGTARHEHCFGAFGTRFCL